MKCKLQNYSFLLLIIHLFTSLLSHFFFFESFLAVIYFRQFITVHSFYPEQFLIKFLLTVNWFSSTISTVLYLSLIFCIQIGSLFSQNFHSFCVSVRRCQMYWSQLKKKRWFLIIYADWTSSCHWSSIVFVWESVN